MLVAQVKECQAEYILPNDCDYFKFYPVSHVVRRVDGFIVTILIKFDDNTFRKIQDGDFVLDEI